MASHDYENKRIKAGDKGKENRKLMKVREELFCLAKKHYSVFDKTYIVLQVLIPLPLKLLTQFPLLPSGKKQTPKYRMSHFCIKAGPLTKWCSLPTTISTHMNNIKKKNKKKPWHCEYLSIKLTV